MATTKQKPHTRKQLLSVAQAAHVLKDYGIKLSEERLRVRINEGHWEIPFFKIGGKGKWFVHREDLVRWVEKQGG